MTAVRHYDTYNKNYKILNGLPVVTLAIFSDDLLPQYVILSNMQLFNLKIKVTY